MSSTLRSTRRALYKTQRTLGDLDAARSGRLPKRLVRRQVMRRGIGPLLNAIFRSVR